jgi:hypothetical protein
MKPPSKMAKTWSAREGRSTATRIDVAMSSSPSTTSWLSYAV